ncbi:AraC family transcriptional regulator [Paraburkholderia sp. BL10I2N1]|uniref:AraC family transcriptional regulator n=1 Tax=Paraburkholderia sp. BL10I2N1 TaxID=1938796 RepID=UPI00105B923F|nr:AraC family transcriptional regulator [Paraburkholderia sp. BL10I2N1]TDN63163.1 AraC-like DNA-binding protein [Paraburkholderia sp. BL10I2N1]
MPNLVRSASLTHFAEIARASGLDPYRLLAEVGLPADSLREVDLKIPAEKVALLLELSAERSRVEAFGLRMAETRRASNLGLLAFLIRDQPTLRHALNAIEHYAHLHNEALFLGVEEEGNVAIIREEFLAGHRVPVRQARELALGVLFRVLHFFLGEDWRPKAVCFAHDAPRDRAVHVRVFGPTLEFGHAFSGIVCDIQDLDLPLPSADPVMGQYIRRYLGSINGKTSIQRSDEVRQLVSLLLPSGRSTIDNIARQMGMSRRTVHRHLAAEGTTFSSILDEVRSELALRYLERAQRPISEVSGLLGFTEPSAFSRWFRTTFGCNPSRFRASRESHTRYI